VETVRGYFERFIHRFPTIEDLAAGSEQDVLRLWEGLGYYRRARQLHAAARQIVTQHGGQVPRDYDALLSLPGIGRYTAGAILSIAHDDRRPILEGNTIRVYSRLLGYTGDPRSKDGLNYLWSFAERILPAKNVGQFNQAMMELGGLACHVRSPNCSECPVRSICHAVSVGQQDQIPIPARRKNYEQVREIAVVVCRRQSVLLRKCADSERWAGLWDFPRFQADRDFADSKRIAEQILMTTGVAIQRLKRFTSLRHGVTRFRIELECYTADYKSGRFRSADGFIWTEIGSLAEYPLNATGRKICQLLGGFVKNE
jgi:A/G-specific adenine glycosylase